MTNGGTLDSANNANNAGTMPVDEKEIPSTPGPPIQWGPDEFEQLRKKIVETDAKAD
jgi:hypothetical protein